MAELDQIRGEIRDTRDMAVKALAVVDSHVDECRRRYESTVRSQATFSAQYALDTATMHTRISGIVKSQRNLMIAIAGWIITSLIMLLGYVAYNGFPWQHS